MLPEQASAWYRRMSIIYAVGAWSVLGSLFLSTRKQKAPGDEVEQKDDSASATASISEIAEPIEGFYVETVVTCKDDFVPVTQSILDYLRSWTGGPGPES
ncbi:small integral membrane protein 26 [Nannospalax galili]|uniref:Small integral membrane protein 26 n=1 Tax=Nannospalax galili TaxID=1026970 RepID=A0A8C6R3M1_NANGA|nr:small integral membrane protein 26 [Nannospalax galili]